MKVQRVISWPYNPTSSSLGWSKSLGRPGATVHALDVLSMPFDKIHQNWYDILISQKFWAHPSLSQWIAVRSCKLHRYFFRWLAVHILCNVYLSLNWFKGTLTGLSAPYFMGKSVLSGSDFPKKTNPPGTFGQSGSFAHFRAIPVRTLHTMRPSPPLGTCNQKHQIQRC